MSQINTGIEKNNMAALVTRILQITAIILAAIILMTTVAVLTYRLLIENKVDKQLSLSDTGVEALYQQQLGEMLERLKTLNEADRQVIRSYILQYNALLLEEIDRLSEPAE